MADIKTRDITRGHIKTLNRAASSMHHIKEADVRIKSAEPYREKGDQPPEGYAAEIAEHYAGSSAAYAARAGVELIQRSRGERNTENIGIAENIHQNSHNAPETDRLAGQNAENIQRAFREQGVKNIRGRQMRNRMADEEVIRNAGELRRSGRVRNASIAAGEDSRRHFAGRSAGIRRKAAASEGRIYRSQKQYAMNRLLSRRNGSRQTILSFLRPGSKGGAGRRGADAASSFIRYIWQHARSYILTVGGGTAAAVIIVTIFVFFGIGVITFSNNSPETSVTADQEEIVYFIPDLSGSPTRQAIVSAAAREVGNVGGEKFWRWYGFNSHVHWCACFTSYVSAECGCIQSGICPKSAVVDGWVAFYKKQHRWARGDYIPHSADFIVFDWDLDGSPDHIGIVESCDGKTVYTIEGNSHDVCKRKSYPRGSSVIYGYCCPAYSGRI